MIRIAHIINPVKVADDNELFWQQPITFQSMKDARGFNLKPNVELLATSYEEDPLPSGFLLADFLERSTLDMDFETKRKLPFFQDILNNAYNNTNADYIIQTNADIGLMPYFYDAVTNMIEQGYEGLIINKRIVPPVFRKVEDLPLIYSEYGTDHNGYDCFIFKRDIYPEFNLGEICMGVPWSETTLTMNMIAYCKNVHVLKHPHLTFHLGDSRTWMNQADLRQHNTQEFCKCLMKLWDKVKDSPITHWLLYKLKQELRPSYCIECHRTAERLDESKLMEYTQNKIVKG